MSDKKRKYVRLSPAVWAEIRALWAIGEATLAGLSNRYGVSTRALQMHFDKEGVTKGSQARAVAASVEAKVFEAMLRDEDQTVQRAIDVREAAYRNAILLENMIVARLEAASRDPEATFATASALKAFAVAAQALERLHGLKRAALGINDDTFRDNDLPTLRIEDLSDEDLREMRARQEEDDADFDPHTRLGQSADEEIVQMA
jgi:hypothetical protein